MRNLTLFEMDDMRCNFNDRKKGETVCTPRIRLPSERTILL
jgi:hypothetical protein